jgi:ABC-2 type transport system permease protein
MDTDTNALPDVPAGVEAAAAAAPPPPQTFLWSVRRELWESRSVYIAPLAVAGLVLFSFLVGSIGLPGRVRAAAGMDALRQQGTLAMPFSMAAAVILLATFVVGAFYCLDALYGERRDRSILFWKSLPVSDLTTVLSKAAIPLAVLPLIGFAVALATQVVMLLLGTLVVLPSGGASLLWTRVPLVRMTGVMAYGLVVHTLWFAPLFAWILLVSAWARRLPLLWAVSPIFVFGILGRLAFDSTAFCSWLGWRVTGPMQVAFDYAAPGGGHRLIPVLHPLNFLATPGLWLGLITAAGFLALAVRLRRSRDPV